MDLEWDDKWQLYLTPDAETDIFIMPALDWIWAQLTPERLDKLTVGDNPMMLRYSILRKGSVHAIRVEFKNSNLYAFRTMMLSLWKATGPPNTQTRQPTLGKGETLYQRKYADCYVAIASSRFNSLTFIDSAANADNPKIIKVK